MTENYKKTQKNQPHMSENNDDKHKLSLEDRMIWHAYVEQEQIEHSEEIDTSSFEELLAMESDIPVKAPKTKDISRSNPQKPSILDRKSNELDRRTDEKLRKGKLPIGARCDLHGLNQAQAHEMLHQFILMAVKRGCRCVLVITGKGKSRVATEAVIEPERGVLKEKVPGWLGGRDLSPYILKTHPAQPKHGGSGAIYVYLRRQR